MNSSNDKLFYTKESNVNENFLMTHPNTFVLTGTVDSCLLRYVNIHSNYFKYYITYNSSDKKYTINSRYHEDTEFDNLFDVLLAASSNTSFPKFLTNDKEYNSLLDYIKEYKDTPHTHIFNDVDKPTICSLCEFDTSPGPVQNKYLQYANTKGNNIEQVFQKKYLKYKHKYLQLKKQLKL